MFREITCVNMVLISLYFPYSLSPVSFRLILQATCYSSGPISSISLSPLPFSSHPFPAFPSPLLAASIPFPYLLSSPSSFPFITYFLSSLLPSTPPAPSHSLSHLFLSLPSCLLPSSCFLLSSVLIPSCLLPSTLPDPSPSLFPFYLLEFPPLFSLPFLFFSPPHLFSSLPFPFPYSLPQQFPLRSVSPAHRS